MKTGSKRLFFVLLAAISMSCTERINDIRLDHTEKRLTVYGEIPTFPGGPWVHLTTSADYFSNEPVPAVSDARVTITSGPDTLRLTEDADHKGYYRTRTHFYGIPGNTYKLLIEGVDIDSDGQEESYDAESYLPKVNRLDSISLNYTSTSFFSGWEVGIWAKDPADERNFYAFRIWKNGVLLTNRLNEYIVQNDDLFNGNYTYGITVGFLNDEDNTERAVPGDTITLDLLGITEGYYRFIQEAQEVSFGNNPLFSGPPANINGNVSHGALGYFTAYSFSRATRIVPDYSSDN